MSLAAAEGARALPVAPPEDASTRVLLRRANIYDALDNLPANGRTLGYSFRASTHAAAR